MLPGTIFPLKFDNIHCKSADGYKVFTAFEGRITWTCVNVYAWSDSSILEIQLD